MGGSDYIQIGQFFHTVLIHDVPQLTLQMKSQLRRFITLIDTLYDNRVRVVISAAVPLNDLFNFSEKPTGIADEQRMLMDDLKLGMVSCLNKKFKLLFTNFFLFLNYSKIQLPVSSPARKKCLPTIVPFPVYMKCKRKNIGNNGLNIVKRCFFFIFEQKIVYLFALAFTDGPQIMFST